MAAPVLEGPPIYDDHNAEAESLPSLAQRFPVDFASLFARAADSPNGRPTTYDAS